MIEFIQKGGPLMWLLLAASVVAVTVFAERWLYLRRITISTGDFLRGLANLIRRGAWTEAQIECKGTPVPVARVVHAAILRHDLARADLKEIVQEAGQLEVPNLERGLLVLSTVAQPTPLVGLLGTVLGMIQAFLTVSSQSGYVTATALSGGVYTSLLTTAASLAVAIPAQLAHNYLSSRVNALMHDLERAGIEVVNLIVDSRPATTTAPEGIIPFARKEDVRRQK